MQFRTSRPHSLMRLGLLVLAAAGLAGQASPSSAQAAPPVSGAQSGYVLPETEVWDLTYTGDEPYRIMVSHPDGPEPPNGYPVLYVLDGNAFFAGVANSRRLQEISDHDLIGSGLVGTALALLGLADRFLDFLVLLGLIVPPIAAVYLADYFVLGRTDYAPDLAPTIATKTNVNGLAAATLGAATGRGLYVANVSFTGVPTIEAFVLAAVAYWGLEKVRIGRGRGRDRMWRMVE